jgi:uncharacterized protein (DUF2164 family)
MALAKVAKALMEERRQVAIKYLKEIKKYVTTGTDLDEKFTILVDFSARTMVSLSFYRSGTSVTRAATLQRIQDITGDLPEPHYDLKTGKQRDLLSNCKFWLVTAPRAKGSLLPNRKLKTPGMGDVLSVHPLDHFITFERLKIMKPIAQDEFERIFR